MAIEHINIGLAANFMDEREVFRSDFIDQLKNINHSSIKETASDRGSGLSSLIVFMEKGLPEFESSDDPYLALEEEFSKNSIEIAEWLNMQDAKTFEKLANGGLKVWVFIEMWIESDQLDLKLPPNLLFECGRLNLSVEIVTNE